MRLTLLSLGIALALAGCGGGADEPGTAAAPSTRQPMASAANPLQASTPATVTVAESVRQLLDEAERRHPLLFPGTQPTQALSPFAYRHYPSTDNHVGVALVSEGPYVAGDVYVMGASFGNSPQSVGALTQYVTPKTNRIVVPLQNNGVVADAVRGVFYASVPGSVVGQGNRIATIDATTGQVRYSAAVGSEPNVMALAADGRSLYVGLDGSGEVVRLSLPGLQKLASVRLPVDSSFSQTRVESLAASPSQAGVFAVSMSYTGVSPRHAGVLLVRDMVAQARRTDGHTGANLVTFNADGSLLYGLNTETTEFGLRRIGLRQDGLEVEAVVAANTGFGVPWLGMAGSTIVAGGSLWGAPKLERLGEVSGARDCRPRRASLLLCASGSFGTTPTLLLVDTTTATIIEVLALPATEGNALGTLVPGPGATAAWREPTRITLIRDEGLR